MMPTTEPRTRGTNEEAIHEPNGGERPVARRARRLASGPGIRDAAARLFLERGYGATSMDDIAAAAHVSKQTIYTHFADKEALFTDLVLGNTERVNEFVQSMVETALAAPDSRAALRHLARTYIRTVSRPEVLRLRRLVIGESGRFPEVARAYYESVPQRMYDALSDLMSDLAARDELRIQDPALAAHQFAWLILGLPIDRGMFLGPEDVMTDDELDRIADAAVSAFLAAYGA